MNLNKQINKKQIFKRAALMLFDALAVNLSFFLATLIYYGVGGLPERGEALVARAPAVAAAFILLFWVTGFYKSLWKYAGIHELTIGVTAVSIGSLVSVSIDKIGNYFGLFGMTFFPASVYINSMLISSLIIGASRLAYRVVRRARGTQLGAARKPRRVMLVGAGNMGMIIIRELAADNWRMGKPVVAVDDLKEKQGSRICGVPIRGGCDRIPELCEQFDVDEIIFCIPAASPERRQELMKLAMTAGRKLKTAPTVLDMTDELRAVKGIRNIDVNDLLMRGTPKPDGKSCQYLCAQTLLVTGAGGSVGGELCRLASRYRPSRIVIFDSSESAASALEQRLSALFGDEPERVVRIGSVCDERRVSEVLEEFHPSVVFHAAAYKNADIIEKNPAEAVKVNVLGTYNVAKAAAACGVKSFVMISSLGAAAPSDVADASKRAAETVVGYFDAMSKSTRFSAVRFGSVLGTSGDLVSRFREQVSAGGPVTLADPDMSRFFISLPEAARLVLRAGAVARGGEIFAVDMGEPVKLLLLAENVIQLAGYIPYRDIPIEFTGLREGERLTEEILLEGEKLADEGLLVTASEKPDTEKTRALFDSLSLSGSAEDIFEELKQFFVTAPAVGRKR